MKALKNLKLIVLAIGIILIALRLFFPVKEFILYSGNNRVKYSALADNSRAKSNLEKSIVVSKTIFQSLGIAILTGGFVILYDLRKKKNGD